MRDVVLTGLLLFAVPVMAQPTPDPSADPGHGAKLMVADGCFQCHGTVGQGSIRTGPALTPNVIPYSAFIGQLRKPMDKMPVYTSVVLSDADASSIYAYLKSLPQPQKPADIALLQN